MPRPIQLPEISDAERSALVERLVVLIEALAQENQRQAETIERLRDEIAVLKGEKAKPTFKPSGMEGGDHGQSAGGRGSGRRRRRGTTRRSAPRKTNPW